VCLLAAFCVAVIAGSVFYLQIWPRHTTEGAGARRARCLAETTRDQDLVVATDWSWCGQLSYFYGRDVVHLIDLALADRERVLAGLATRVSRVHDRGGSVFILDLDHAPASYLERLSRQTGLTLQDWNRVETASAFVCEGHRFAQVTAVQDVLASLSSTENPLEPERDHPPP
jgi:hypothetical protein